MVSWRADQGYSILEFSLQDSFSECLGAADSPSDSVVGVLVDIDVLALERLQVHSIDVLHVTQMLRRVKG